MWSGPDCYVIWDMSWMIGGKYHSLLARYKTFKNGIVKLLNLIDRQRNDQKKKDNNPCGHVY
jgi:hypothetical protein